MDWRLALAFAFCSMTTSTFMYAESAFSDPCVGSNSMGNTSAGTIAFVPDSSYSSSAIDAGLPLWTACSEHGTGFPHLKKNGIGDFQVPVEYRPGISTATTGACAEVEIVISGSTREMKSAEVRLFEFMRLPDGSQGIRCASGAGRDFAHEVGHIFGLADQEFCDSYIMGAGRTVHANECAAADEVYTTPAENPPGGGGGDGPFDEPCYDSCTPIVIDVSGRGFSFTGLDHTVRFDIDGDGFREEITWTGPWGDEAFLVLDRNSNGLVDDGTELFGGVTPQLLSEELNGFLALAMLDREDAGGNYDGLISSLDESFSQLRLWRDSNHDGVSQPWELATLDSHGIVAIELQYVTSGRRDRHGNLLRWTAMVHFSVNKRRAAADVIFLEK